MYCEITRSYYRNYAEPCLRMLSHHNKLLTYLVAEGKILPSSQSVTSKLSRSPSVLMPQNLNISNKKLLEELITTTSHLLLQVTAHVNRTTYFIIN